MMLNLKVLYLKIKITVKNSTLMIKFACGESRKMVVMIISVKKYQNFWMTLTFVVDLDLELIWQCAKTLADVQ